MFKMKHAGVLGLALLMLVAFGACKHSGVAVTGKGQVLKIDLDIPQDLSEGQTEELKVSVANRGVNEIDDVWFEVEMPSELIVLSQKQSRGVKWTERVSTMGTKVYRYEAGDIEVGNEAEVTYHVRAAFGSLQRTGDIKTTAWADELPGEKLVETRFIRLRR